MRSRWGVVAILGLMIVGCAAEPWKQWAGQLKDKDPEIRRYACRQLAELGPAATPAIPQLIEALQDSDEMTRGLAAVALGDIGKNAIAPIEAAYPKQTNVGKTYSAVALGLIGPEAAGAAKLIAPGLTSTDKLLQLETAKAIAHLQPKNADGLLEPLIAALKTPDLLVRSSAAEALASIGSAAKPAVDELAAIVEMPEGDFLAALGPQAKDAKGPAQELLKRDIALTRLNAAFAIYKVSGIPDLPLPSIIDGLKYHDPGVQVIAAQMLLIMGPAAAPAKEELEKLTKSENQQVSEAAKAALQAIDKK